MIETTASRAFNTPVKLPRSPAPPFPPPGFFGSPVGDGPPPPVKIPINFLKDAISFPTASSPSKSFMVISTKPFTIVSVIAFRTASPSAANASPTVAVPVMTSVSACPISDLIVPASFFHASIEVSVVTTVCSMRPCSSASRVFDHSPTPFSAADFHSSSKAIRARLTSRSVARPTCAASLICSYAFLLDSSPAATSVERVKPRALAALLANSRPSASPFARFAELNKTPSSLPAATTVSSIAGATASPATDAIETIFSLASLSASARSVAAFVDIALTNSATGVFASLAALPVSRMNPATPPNIGPAVCALLPAFSISSPAALTGSATAALKSVARKSRIATRKFRAALPTLPGSFSKANSSDCSLSTTKSTIEPTAFFTIVSMPEKPSATTFTVVSIHFPRSVSMNAENATLTSSSTKTAPSHATPQAPCNQATTPFSWSQYRVSAPPPATTAAETPTTEAITPVDTAASDAKPAAIPPITTKIGPRTARKATKPTTAACMDGSSRENQSSISETPAMTLLRKSAIGWKKGIKIVPSFRSSKPDSSTSRSTCPIRVLACFSIVPAKRSLSPATRASTPLMPSIAPLPASSIALGTSTPIFSARISHAGIPRSASCAISSAETLALARIWPSAVVTPAITSFPPPTALTASPTAVSIGITSSDAKPKASIFFAADSSPGKSKGVLAANFARSFRKASAFSALPSIVVNAICDCSKSPAILSAAPPSPKMAGVMVIDSVEPTAAILSLNAARSLRAAFSAALSGLLSPAMTATRSGTGPPRALPLRFPLL